jgi:hypothetical protein
MTWIAGDDAYEVFFNRDERRTRRPAEPPRIRRSGEMRYIAPADGDFGGAWIAVNEAGLTLALENGYVDLDDRTREPEGGFTSRGLLLTSLIDESSAEGVLKRLDDAWLRQFRSFLLTIFDPRSEGVLASWMLGRLTVDRGIDRLMPLVSSSFETATVRRTRHDVFRRMAEREELDDTALHLAYHRSHEPERGPGSPCMHRPEAHTVSFSHIEVSPREVRFHYVGDSPCRGLPEGPPVTLPRRSDR